jgi:hypothetical protein
MYREGIDDLVNEDNPLRQRLEFSRHKIHEKKQLTLGGGSGVKSVRAADESLDGTCAG